jgi:3'-phosphoadenosine 5'-phosphosulfate sulfotransferase (PAPS reductase)/FAD synthetase
LLIVTDRHTPEDLQLYNSLYRPIDCFTRIPQRKVDESFEVLESWVNEHDDAVAYTSWGKDSVVLMHMIATIGWQIPCVYVKTERANPDCDLVRDKFFTWYPYLSDFYHEETFRYDEVAANDGHWKAVAAKHGQHRITGIRKDESGIRRMVWGKFGMASDLSCRPLSLWTNSEIFAYIEQHDLPLNPVYGYLGGGRWDRKHIRTHSLVGTSGDNRGRTEWEREFYPDRVNKILSGQV